MKSTRQLELETLEARDLMATAVLTSFDAQPLAIEVPDALVQPIQSIRDTLEITHNRLLETADEAASNAFFQGLQTWDHRFSTHPEAVEALAEVSNDVFMAWIDQPNDSVQQLHDILQEKEASSNQLSDAVSSKETLQQEITVLDGTIATLQQTLGEDQSSLVALEQNASITPQWNGAPTVSGAAAEVTLSGNVPGGRVSPDGKHLLLGSGNGVVRMIDVATGTVRVVAQLPKIVDAVAWSPDGKTFAANCYDNNVRIYDASSLALLRTVNLGGLGSKIAYSADSKKIVAGQAAPANMVIDVASGTIDRALSTSNASCRFDVLPDGSVVYAKGTNVVINRNGTDVLTLGFGMKINIVAASKDGTLVAVGDHGSGTLKLYDTANGKQLCSIKLPCPYFESVFFGKDGILYVSGSDAIVRTYTLTRSGDTITAAASIIGSNFFVYDITPDGAYLTYCTATGSGSGLYATGNATGASPEQLLALRTSIASDTALLADLKRERSEKQARLSELDVEIGQLEVRVGALAVWTQELEKTNTSLSLTSLVEQAVDAQENIEIIQPHLHLSNLLSNGSGFSLTIQYSTPSDTAYVTIPGVASAEFSHADGTTEGYVTLGNNGLQTSKVYAVHLYDGPGGTILQTAYVHWNPEARTGSILTEQDESWGTRSKTLSLQSAERQVEPGLAADIQGRVIFVSYQTPHDHAVIQISRTDEGGLYAIGTAAQELVTHVGGTTTGMVQLAIPANTRPGTLQIQLLDKAFGTLLTTLTVQWDGTSATIIGEAVQAFSEVQHNVLLTTVTGLRPDIAFIQQLSLFEQSTFMINGGEQFMTLLKQAFPTTFPLDQEAEITRRWAAASYAPQRGVIEQELLAEQRDKRDQLTVHLHNYETAMSSFLMKAVQYWVDIKNGASEKPLSDALWTEYHKLDIAGMSPLGIGKPSFDTFIKEAHRLYTQNYSQLLQFQSDEAQASIADANREQAAEQRTIDLHQIRTNLEAILGSLASSNGTITLATQYLRTQNSQYLSNWAQELFESYSFYQINTEVLTGFLSAQLQNTVFVMQEDANGIGGTDAVSSILNRNPMENKNDLVKLYTSTTQIPAIVTLGEFRVHSTNEAGRIFLGLYQNALSIKEDAKAVLELSAKVESVLGIPRGALYGLIRHQSNDYAVFRSKLVELFRNFGFTSAFEDASSSTHPIQVSINNTIYSSGHAHLTFNTPYGRTIDHVMVNIVRNGTDINVVEGLVQNLQGKLYIDIPISAIGPINDVQFKVIAWFSGETDDRNAIKGYSESFSIQGPIYANEAEREYDLSTSADKEQRQRENVILNVLRTHFPLQTPSADEWHVYIASSKHGANADNALDFNLSAGDYHKPVVAPARGEIVDKGTGNDAHNTVTLKHTTVDSLTGKPVVWYTQYLHMDSTGVRQADGTIKAFAVGDIIEEGDVIGLVSDIGAAKGAYHLHFEVNMEGTWGESINLAHLVEKMGIEVKAQADVIHTTDTEGGSITQSVSQGPAQTVIWNDALNAWVTGTAENGPGGAHLVLDRRATETATDVSTYWLAYEEGKSMDEMKRVVWDMDANVWAQWDATTNSFFRENGYRKIWNPSSQSWSIEQ